MLQWLETHAGDRLTLAAVAARAGLSVRTLNRRFREQTGQTPMQWVTGARVRRAQELLETTDYGVDRIAHLVGFASPAHFRTQFKRLSGVPPHAYRTTFSAEPPTTGGPAGQPSRRGAGAVGNGDSRPWRRTP